MEAHEFLSRAVFVFFGGVLFEPPLLKRIRMIMYTKLFRLGEGCRIGAHTVFYREHALKGVLRIGSDVAIGSQVVIDYSGGCIIGRGTWISHRAAIFTHIHPVVRGNGKTGDEPTPKPLVIGNNVWVGYQAIILPTVGSIGHNAVIGAGAVVSHPVPPGAVMVGNPARVSKKKVVNVTN